MQSGSGLVSNLMAMVKDAHDANQDVITNVRFKDKLQETLTSLKLIQTEHKAVNAAVGKLAAIKDLRTKAAPIKLDPDDDINATFEKLLDGKTLLCFAVATGNLGFTDQLLSAGADPNTPDRKGFPPLHYAVEQDSPELTKKLISVKANVLYRYRCHNDNQTALHVAARNHRNKVIPALLPCSTLNLFDSLNDTALMSAVWVGNLEAARMLYTAGWDPNIRDKYSNGTLSVLLLSEQDEKSKLEIVKVFFPPQTLTEAKSSTTSPVAETKMAPATHLLGERYPIKISDENRSKEELTLFELAVYKNLTTIVEYFLKNNLVTEKEFNELKKDYWPEPGNSLSNVFTFSIWLSIKNNLKMVETLIAHGKNLLTVNMLYIALAAAAEHGLKELAQKHLLPLLREAKFSTINLEEAYDSTLNIFVDRKDTETRKLIKAFWMGIKHKLNELESAVFNNDLSVALVTPADEKAFNTVRAWPNADQEYCLLSYATSQAFVEVAKIILEHAKDKISVDSAKSSKGRRCEKS